MVHMHHSQPLKMKFGTNHFLGSETLVPLQYRVRVKVSYENSIKIFIQEILCPFNSIGSEVGIHCVVNVGA